MAHLRVTPRFHFFLFSFFPFLHFFIMFTFLMFPPWWVLHGDVVY